MNFKFFCPKCNQRLEAPTEMGGQSLACPACAHQFTIPMPGSQTSSVRTPLVRLKPPPSSRPKPLSPVTASPGPMVALRPPAASPPAEPEQNVEQEVSDLLAVCDPDRLGPLKSLDEELGESGAPVPVPVGDPVLAADSDPELAGSGEATTVPMDRSKVWILAVVGSSVCFALLLGGGIWLNLKRRHAQNPPAPKVLKVEVPPPPVIVLDEETCYRDLGGMALGDLPVTEERASALLRYLGSFPQGAHRSEALVFAVTEASRALEKDDELPKELVEQYAQIGRTAANEILLQPGKVRDEAMSELARLAVRLCWHSRDAKNLALAERVIAIDDSAHARNAEIYLAGLADDTPAETRQTFEDELFKLALRAEPASWSDAWAQVTSRVALRLAEDPNSDAQRLVRVAVGLHDTGRKEEGLQLVRLIAQRSLSGEGRQLARAWWLCWDPAEAAKMRSAVLAKAEDEYRRQLANMLQTINRRELARRLGLPWPVPPTPKVTPAEAIDAHLAAVDADVAKAFPEDQLKQAEAEIAERYIPYRIGDEITVRIQRGAVGETVKGRYHSRTVSHVRIGDRDVLVSDLSGNDRFRFDVDACEKEKRELVEARAVAFKKRREVYRERLLAKLRAEAPAAAGYIWRDNQWQDPQAVYSQGLERVAEAASAALRKKLMEEMLSAAGFRAEGGTWVPIPPRIAE